MAEPKRESETFVLDGDYIASQVEEGLRDFFAPVTGAFNLVERVTRPKGYAERMATRHAAIRRQRKLDTKV